MNWNITLRRKKSDSYYLNINFRHIAEGYLAWFKYSGRGGGLLPLPTYPTPHHLYWSSCIFRLCPVLYLDDASDPASSADSENEVEEDNTEQNEGTE